MSDRANDLQALRTARAAYLAGEIDAARTAASVIEVIFERLGCDRVSLWRFDLGAVDRDGRALGGIRMRCFARQLRGGAFQTDEDWLTEAEYAAYFDALIETGAYASDDALADPNLRAMRGTYLERHGIRALLDALFLVNGRAYGVVCCEQTGATRHWRAGEATALRAIVAKVALLMSDVDDPLLAHLPALPLRPRR